ncbi:hypothetical protein [Vibrio harveyi]|uniref:hypothetical protein n=1 Tax=Vibrio harveyi TaxID=669 RepID=UPI003BB6BB39
MSEGRPRITYRLPPEILSTAQVESAQQKLSLNEYCRNMCIRGMTVGADQNQYEFLAKQLVNLLTINQRLAVKICELEPTNTHIELAQQDAFENILNPARNDAISILKAQGIIKED